MIKGEESLQVASHELAISTVLRFPFLPYSDLGTSRLGIQMTRTSSHASRNKRRDRL